MINKTTQNLNAIKDYLEKVENLIEKAKEPNMYTTCTGKTIKENCGTYNPNLTKSMALDMLDLKKPSLSYISEELELKDSYYDILENGYLKMLELNSILTFNLKNYKANKPLKFWPYKEIQDFLEGMTEIFESDYTKSKYKNKIKSWVERLLYMNSWNYYLEQYIDIEETLNNNSIKNDKDIIDTLCIIRKFLLKAFIKSKPLSDNYEELLEKIEFTSILTDSIIHNRVETLYTYLEK